MSYWLGGYNDRGILTDISNSAFNVRDRYRRRQGEA
jgi:hypothetical protein